MLASTLPDSHCLCQTLFQHKLTESLLDLNEEAKLLGFTQVFLYESESHERATPKHTELTC